MPHWKGDKERGGGRGEKGPIKSWLSSLSPISGKRNRLLRPDKKDKGGGVFMRKYCREKKEQKKAIVIDKVR